jgi:hypothetical protein
MTVEEYEQKSRGLTRKEINDKLTANYTVINVEKKETYNCH